MNNSIPAIGLRLASMLLDHIFMCIILIVPIVVLNLLSSGQDDNGLGPVVQLALVGLLVLYFLKDSFDGRSLAKRITKLRVVNNTTGETASAARCFVRNIFIIIWPIELLISVFSPQRRIGDFVAGTKVIVYTVKPVKLEE